MQVHIFIGRFKNREEAISYSEAYWEPEPASSESIEEREAWTNRNPVWKMRNDLECYLDSDFIETITEGNKLDYLKSNLKNPDEAGQFTTDLDLETSALILIYDEALDSKTTDMKSTSRIDYKGCFRTKEL